MDLYLPSFPQIGRELAAEPALVQLTLTGAFVGMAIGQLAAGPLSDRVGRMRPLVIVLSIYAAATIGCALAPSIGALIALRFGQGVGASASAVIVLAIIRDSASGPRLVTLLARIQLVNGVFVIGAPALGAQLLLVFDWRGIFWLLVGYGVALVVVALTVLLPRETNPRERRAEQGRPPLRADYAALVRDRRFVAVIVAGALQWGAMMAYMSSSAFLFQDLFGLSPTTYAIIFGAHGALMIAGAQLSARFAHRVPVERVLVRGLVVLASVAGALLLSVLLVPGLGILGFVVPLFAFTTTFGIISPAVQSTALTPHGDRAGAAASLLGASNMVAGAVASPLVGVLGVGTVPVAALMTVCAAGALASVLIGFGRTRRMEIA